MANSHKEIAGTSRGHLVSSRATCSQLPRTMTSWFLNTWSIFKDEYTWMESPRLLCETRGSTKSPSFHLSFQSKKCEKLWVVCPGLLVTTTSSVSAWETTTSTPCVQMASGAHCSASVVTTCVFGKKSPP